ncbi:carboxypeptidase regulatory-like domain-containing protein [Myxococcota bacterium]
MNRAAFLALATCSACGGAKPGSAVVGHAVFSGLQDHKSILVQLSDSDFAVETDRFGYFAITDVPRGEYVVTAGHPGTLERRVSRIIEHDGTTPSNVHLVLTPVGALEGRVVDPGGEPLVSARVRRLTSEERATTVDHGRFVIDPAVAGPATLIADAVAFDPKIVTTTVPVGGTAVIDIELAPSSERDPYEGNREPVIERVVLEAAFDDSFPRVIPLVNTVASDKVRRRALYRLSAEVHDPEADPVTVFWSADRGTLESSTGSEAMWRAGAGVSTVTCTAVDVFGATTSVRKVVTASADMIRGGGRWGSLVFYSENRGEGYDVFAYDLGTGEETVEVGGANHQHAPQVIDDWLIYGDTEFVFTTPLTYRIAATNLVTGTTRSFGQSFDHDSAFVVDIDIYTPVTAPLVPYNSSDSSIAPTGPGLFDPDAGQATSVSVTPPPAYYRSMAGAENRVVWVTVEAEVWTRTGDGNVAKIADPVPDHTGLADILVQGDLVAWVTGQDGPIYWLDMTTNAPPRSLGLSVPSFAMHGDHIAYVEQGPTSASVFLANVSTGQVRTLSIEPHYYRRIWSMDDHYVIWGDQGAQGQTFMPHLTELLWIDRYD